VERRRPGASSDGVRPVWGRSLSKLGRRPAPTARSAMSKTVGGRHSSVSDSTPWDIASRLTHPKWGQTVAVQSARRFGAGCCLAPCPILRAASLAGGGNSNCREGTRAVDLARQRADQIVPPTFWRGPRLVAGPPAVRGTRLVLGTHCRRLSGGSTGADLAIPHPPDA